MLTGGSSKPGFATWSVQDAFRPNKPTLMLAKLYRYLFKHIIMPISLNQVPKQSSEEPGSVQSAYLRTAVIANPF